MPAKRIVAAQVKKRFREFADDDAFSGLAPSTRKMKLLASLKCDSRHERALRLKGAETIAGIDEVGCGALFGPVVAAAVILPKGFALAGLRDSKQLDAETRERMAAHIHRRAIAVEIEAVDAETIDRINIYQARRMAMTAAVMRLNPVPDHLLIDAMTLDLPHAQTNLLYGDSLSVSIAAASVVAKVFRDALVRELAEAYPQYGLAANKGYSTPGHKRALREHGPSPLHRRSFWPVGSLEPLEPAVIASEIPTTPAPSL
jgi:ribonuclease HII